MNAKDENLPTEITDLSQKRDQNPNKIGLLNFLIPGLGFYQTGNIGKSILTFFVYAIILYAAIAEGGYWGFFFFINCRSSFTFYLVGAKGIF